MKSWLRLAAGVMVAVPLATLLVAGICVLAYSLWVGAGPAVAVLTGSFIVGAAILTFSDEEG